MNRRDAMKILGAAALATTLSANENKDEYKNRLEMKPENPNKPQKSELKHMPQISLGKTDAKGYTNVEITVGQAGIIHPSTQDHWIDFIELYADNKLVGKNELMPEISRGASSYAVKLKGVKALTAKAGCNLHGIWSSSIKL
jgi:superoxide reductase